MTTKQDYMFSILHSLAGIALSDPSHSLLETIDAAMSKFHRDADPKRLNMPHNIDDAQEILDLYLNLIDLVGREDFSE